METIIRNVDEIDASDRQALEHMLGRSLSENLQIEIRIVNLHNTRGTTPVSVPLHSNDIPKLPEWCNVYDGLSDEEIADIEKIILQRADLTRPSE